MKKTIFILSVVIFCLQFGGFSQKSMVGITGGLSLANMRGTVDGKDQKGDSKLGYTLGLIIDVPLKDQFTFQPGLHYVQKGKKVEQGPDQELATALRYAELQLNFLYSVNSDGTILFIGGGPAFCAGLPSKFVTKMGEIKSEADITFGDETADIRSSDWGANFLGGLRFPSGFFISLNYTLGLRNLVPGGSDTDKLKNSCFGVRIGLLIANK